jgi:hypothetical protein
MTTKDEALKLALEALEIQAYNSGDEKYTQAITAIKQALTDSALDRMAENARELGLDYEPAPVQQSRSDVEPVGWKWHRAPVKTSWGHDMVVADLAIDKDNTVSVYCERDQMAKVEAMFNSPAQPAPVQEPVAWMDGYRNIYSLEEKAAGCEDAVIPLVPAIQHWSDCAVHNEPAYPKGDCDCGSYTAPPNVATPPAAQRQWVGLTDEEILAALCIHVDESDDPDEWWSEIKEVRAIEAKLKEKNSD